MTKKIISITYFVAIFWSLIPITFISCSKDDNLLSQKDIVELTLLYRETLNEITACNDRIASLEEELEKTPAESANIIEEMIGREKMKLEQLEQKRTDLEKKLGLE